MKICLEHSVADRTLLPVTTESNYFSACCRPEHLLWAVVACNYIGSPCAFWKKVLPTKSFTGAHLYYKIRPLPGPTPLLQIVVGFLMGHQWPMSAHYQKKSAISYFVWCVFTNTDVVWRKQIFVFKIITFYLISRGMKSMFSDESARVGTYDTFYGYGTVDTVGAVRWVRWGTVRWVRWVRYCGYGGYGTVRAGPPYSTHSTHCTVPSLPTVPYPAYPLYRTHRTHRTVPTVPTVPYHRTQRTAPFTVPSFLRTVPPHRALLLKFKKITFLKNIMYYNVDLRFFNPP